VTNVFQIFCKFIFSAWNFREGDKYVYLYIYRKRFVTAVLLKIIRYFHSVIV